MDQWNRKTYESKSLYHNFKFIDASFNVLFFIFSTQKNGGGGGGGGLEGGRDHLVC